MMHKGTSQLEHVPNRNSRDYIASIKIVEYFTQYVQSTCMYIIKITCCLQSTIEMLIIYGTVVPSNTVDNWAVYISLFDRLRSWVSMCRSLVGVPCTLVGLHCACVCVCLLVFCLLICGHLSSTVKYVSIS